MKDLLQSMFDHKVLSENEAYDTLVAISRGSYSEVEVSSFLTVFQMRSIALSELKGFRNALIDLSKPIDFSDFNCVDMCGTGGDGKDTFNISTLASFVVAGAGYHVAKHGNNGVSSACGSSNVMNALGYQFSNDESVMKKQLERSRITFMHAPLFHPAMKEVAPVRKQLRVKTFFNMLGPMVNPSRPQKQIVGVYSLAIARLYNYIYQEENRDYSILHSLDGYDEISLTGTAQAISNKGEQMLNPSDFGTSKTTPEAIYGGKAIKDAAFIFNSILKGEGTDDQNNVVCANAALAIQLFRPEESLESCFHSAQESLFSGRANQSLQTLLSL